MSEHCPSNGIGKMREPRFGCPYCGSEEIEEVNEVIAWYPVTAWTEEGDPAEFGAPSYGDGEAVDEGRFLCRRCLGDGGGRAFQFDEPKRLDASVPPSGRASASGRLRAHQDRSRRQDVS